LIASPVAGWRQGWMKAAGAFNGLPRELRSRHNMLAIYEPTTFSIRYETHRPPFHLSMYARLLLDSWRACDGGPCRSWQQRRGLPWNREKAQPVEDEYVR
jgi:hypothetical protein